MSVYDTEPDALDPGHWRTAEDRDDDCTPICDDCGATIGIGAVSLAGVGLFCSRDCATRGTQQHERVMRRA